jgi:hypothetical protein
VTSVTEGHLCIARRFVETDRSHDITRVAVLLTRQQILAHSLLSPQTEDRHSL